MPRLPVIVLLFASLFWSMSSRADAPRIALVIGNSDYPSGPLPNPANDAKLMNETLKSMGFQVIFRSNADQNTMKRAIQEFGGALEKAGPSAVGLFYYAGHGVALAGINYLIPTTAKIDREGDVEIEGVSADWVMEQMRYARNSLNIVILDACRNNPFVRSMRAANRGLANMDPPTGAIVAYSTAPGSVASDGAGKNSPYTESLTRAMRSGSKVEDVFKAVRVNVIKETGGKQIPWELSSLTGDFYFTAAPAQATAAVRPPAPAPLPPPAAAARQDTAPDASRSSGGAFWSNLFGSSAKPEPTRPGGSPVKVAAGGATIAGVRAMPVIESLGIAVPDLQADHDYPKAAIQQLIERTPRQVTLGNSPAQKQAALALCRQYDPRCRADQFSDEAARSTTLKPFQLDNTLVSVQAFREFVSATLYQTDAEKAGFGYALDASGKWVQAYGGTWRNGMKQRSVSEDSAVIGVSYQDAVAYCRYRGKRLPTEDEWEYVARGPELHIFPWGDETQGAAARPGRQPAFDAGPDGGIGGRYLGLAGNVWQWVDTTYTEPKSKLQYRIMKGGSWLERNPANKRAAARGFASPDQADDDGGFRCAKSVPAWPDTELWMAKLK